MSHLPPRVHLVSLVGGSSRVGVPLLGWRLLGGNNRELGRGSTTTTTIDQMADLILRLQVSLPDAAIGHRRGQHIEGWSWFGCWSEVEMVHSARAFRRERESRYNADAFVVAFALAELRAPESGTRMPHAAVATFLPTRASAVTPAGGVAVAVTAGGTR